MATKKKIVKRGEPAIPVSLNTPEFAAAWAEWLRFTEDRGMPLADDDAARQLKLLAKLGPEKAIADIRKTMDEHPLKDRFPDKKGKKGEKAEAPAEDAAKEAGEARPSPRRARMPRPPRHRRPKR